MAGNIGEEQAANATGGTTRDVVDIAAALGPAKRLAIDPDIETSQFDPTGRELAASPDFHALHVLRGGIHRSIITGETRRVRLEPFGRSEQIPVSRLAMIAITASLKAPQESKIFFGEGHFFDVTIDNYTFQWR
jgi:hypothetical protein